MGQRNEKNRDVSVQEQSCCERLRVPRATPEESGSTRLCTVTKGHSSSGLSPPAAVLYQWTVGPGAIRPQHVPPALGA